MITTTTTGGGGGGGSSSSACTVLKKGPWSAAEDGVLMEYVKKNGEGNWNAVQRNTGLQRCGKSCRLRWANHLRPNLKKGAFSVDEERLIIDLHSKLGNKWARISSHLPGRTDNEIKNYWNTRVKRRLRQGLPLYPNQNHTIPCQTPKIAPLQPPSSLPFSFQKNTSSNNNNINNNTNSTLSLFNPVSFPSPYFSLHHPPSFLPSNFLRHCPNTTVPGRPPSSLSQMGTTFQLSSSGFGAGFGFDSGQVPVTRFGSEGSFNFDSPRNFELPSNQLHQNADQGVVHHHQEVKINHNNSNMGRTKSGLLDDLLQEAQVKVAGRGVKRERDDSGLHWDVSTSENSCTGIKKEAEGQQLKLGNEELSNILELIPSLVQVPGWCNDNGGDESPAGQSASVVSTDDNYDKMPLPEPLPVVSTSDYEDDGDDWNPSCYTWDNLPRIC